jgi:hypothetical protein
MAIFPSYIQLTFASLLLIHISDISGVMGHNGWPGQKLHLWYLGSESIL